MDFEIFENLVKDGLTNLFDYAALETHPLIDAGIRPPPDFKGSRSDYLKSVLMESINSLKPHNSEFDFYSMEWRSFVILSERYIENINSTELARKLLLGERQIRRSQKKAIRAVALLLWDRIQNSMEKSQDVDKTNDFLINREKINVGQVVLSILDLLKNHFENQNVWVNFVEPEDSLEINSDRIIIRQVLIRVFHIFLQNSKCHRINLRLEKKLDEIELVFHLPNVNFDLDMMLTLLHVQENMIRHWLNELNIQLLGDRTSEGFNFIIRFLNPEKKLILVVDDQEPALKMFERYLSRTNYKIFGLSKATKVLPKAIELKPALILLDIMMPKLDGWEILQSLRLNEITKHIPIVVCSAWGEPDLAKSLGADYFLSKPIMQKELLEVLARYIGE